MDPAIAQQLYHYVKTPHDYKKLRGVNKAMAHYIPPQGNIKLKDYFCTDDFCKMEMYINQTRSQPDWFKIESHLQSFKYIPRNTPEGWYKHHWAMYQAFNAYGFYKKKSDYDPINKGLTICWNTINVDVAEDAYAKLRSKNITTLKDFYNFLIKNFTLKMLECMGY